MPVMQIPQAQTDFQRALQPASFKGARFGVLDSRYQGGRRDQVHEYPLRDNPYTEDLGRRAQRISFTAFVIGDTVGADRDALITALETKGPGDLVHPTFVGSRQMQVDGPFEAVEKWDKGRYVEFQLAFVEPGQQLFPTDASDTPAATNSAADTAETATIGSFNTVRSGTGATEIPTGSQIDGGGTIVTLPIRRALIHRPSARQPRTTLRARRQTRPRLGTRPRST